MRETLYFIAGYALAPLRRGTRNVRVHVRESVTHAKNYSDSLFDELWRNGLTFAALIFSTVLILFMAGRPVSIPLPVWLVGVSIRAGMAASVLTLVIAVICAFRRDEAVTDREKVERDLAGTCPPDSEPYNIAVVMRGAAWCDRTNFLHEFRSVPAEAQGVILVLRQTRARWHYSTPYMFESMRRQLSERKNHPEFSKIKVDWVCFENKHGTFEAYMGYSRFEADILERRNTAYAELLSLTGVEEFRAALARHKANDDDQKKAGVVKPDTIGGLETRCVSRELSKREVLTRLVTKGESDIMLASDDRKRLGVVTLAKLVEKMLGGFIHQGPALEKLNSRIEEWDKQSLERAREIESRDIPAQPPITGDDSPGYDKMVPFRGARRRPDLRLTPP